MSHSNPTAVLPPVCVPDADHGPAAPKFVLVVDDEPEIASLLCDLLQDAGYCVQTAASGFAALGLLDSKNFDAILSDLHMPGMDGPALWQQVASRAPALAQRMMFVTGDTLGTAASAFLARTGCPRLDKPFRRTTLLQQLRLMLEQPTSERLPS